MTKKKKQHKDKLLDEVESIDSTLSPKNEDEIRSARRLAYIKAICVMEFLDLYQLN